MKVLTKSVIATFGLLALSVVMISPALANCNMELDITNGFNVPIKIVEIKTSTNPPVYKSQWTGFEKIKAGASKTFYFTTDADCVDGTGVNQLWDMRIFRDNGKRHNCFNIDDTASVTLRKPDNC